MSTACLLIALIAGGIGSLEASEHTVPTTPGFHQSLRLDGQEHHPHLYLPQGFDARQAGPGYPVLVIHNPSGRTKKDVERFMPWADREAVVIIGINGPRNGMPDHNKPKIQDGALRAIGDALPLHPTLRFATGMSGGSADGWRMIRRQAQHFSGVVFQGITGSLGSNHGHLVVVIHFGAKDEWNVRPIYERMLPDLEQRNMAYWLEVDLDRGHEWAPTDEQFRALSFMLWQARLTREGIAEDERSGYRQALSQRIAQTLRTQSSAERHRALADVLRLDLDGIAQREAALKAWLDGEAARLHGLDTASQAVALSLLLDSPQARQLVDDQRRRLEARRDDLASSPAVAGHYRSGMRYHDLVAAEKRAGLVVEDLQPVADGYAALAATGDHPWQQAAAERSERLTTLITSKPRRVGQ